MPSTIDIPTLVKDVKRLARENPDRVARCHYVRYLGEAKTPTPECIVGVALIKQGVPISTLRRYNNAGIPSLLDTLLDDDPALTQHQDEITWLYRVQDFQDSTLPWKRAVKEANRVVKLG